MVLEVIIGTHTQKHDGKMMKNDFYKKEEKEIFTTFDSILAEGEISSFIFSGTLGCLYKYAPVNRISAKQRQRKKHKMSACPRVDEVLASYPQICKDIFDRVLERSNSDSPKDYVDATYLRCESDSPARVGRPMNSFLIFKAMFRKELIKDGLYEDICSTFKIAGNQKAHLIPKISSKFWRDLDKTRKESFVTFARKVKEEHEKAFPGYRYIPQRRNRGLGFRPYVRPTERSDKRKCNRTERR
ncbi:15881_t:CDS:1 [Acaulospora colombiana]|uniref:15881_t:CDS:1 n=1 Tax=Acaulospora colombiana TaxID=27376 RepID=A0ACA9LC24_9GLOM|nr:15881_t:CDS:1 [Acaulospora colombiana]